ncbi:MAG: A/G-specific adenine glycosylase [candidate division KSB1 bacterium]|nr:A/G-specific adenine glycosylase [candidate division KSB1 bacterium]MDZ7345990.1 A/G-specific adenine glycosylase [candidate division KSB1 bacterium]
MKKFHAELLAWFEESSRDLPWRRTRDPYSIWISEVMLQQTQVKTVEPYYCRFIAAFPTVEHLAAADLSQVLKLWEGLGYYARARNLKKAAELIVKEYGGVFPKTLQEILNLPGVGPYTAAAVLSIAYGADIPAIDGNVSRVLSRLVCLPVDPRSSEGRRMVGLLAEEYLAKGRAGDFNQALMELGATLCRPKDPLCGRCPIAAFCRAQRENRQHLYPVRLPKKPRPHVNVAAGLVWKDGKLLIDRRREDDMLGGLWEFPGGKIKENETPEQTVVREIKEELGIDVEVTEHFMSLNHGYTHFTITLHVFSCRHRFGEPQAIDCAEWRWVTREELPRYAFPRADGKIIAKILQEAPR